MKTLHVDGRMYGKPYSVQAQIRSRNPEERKSLTYSRPLLITYVRGKEKRAIDQVRCDSSVLRPPLECNYMYSRGTRFSAQLMNCDDADATHIPSYMGINE